MSTSVESSFLARHVVATNRQETEGTSFIGKFWGLILFCVSIICVFAVSVVLFSYNKNDPGFSHISSSDHVHNILGLQGAWLADLVYLLLGWGAWVCVFGGLFFLIRGWKRLRGHPMKDSSVPMGLRVFSFLILVLACCALFFMRFHTYGEQMPGTIGGALGSTIGSEILYWLDFKSATAVLLIIIAFSASIFLGFSWVSLSESIGGFFEGIVTGIRRRQENREDEALGIATLKQRESKREQPVESNADNIIFRDGESLPEPVVTAEPKDITQFSPIKLHEETKVELPAQEQTKLELEEPDEPTKPVMSDSEVTLPPEAAIFKLPDISLLNDPPYHRQQVLSADVEVTRQRIEKILNDYGLEATVSRYLRGPLLTRFTLLPKPGEKSKRFVQIADDLARRLGVAQVRVIENMKEVDSIGLEIPNPPEAIQTISFKQIIESEVFQKSTAPMALGLGLNTAGDAVVTDLAKAPHLLVAGTTGSGKSVGINSMILSMLYKNTPDQLRLILVDPKQVEFTPYADIPHLMTPVINDMVEAARALGWAVKEMERRYTLLNKARVRKIEAYNEKVNNGELPQPMTVDPDTGEPVPWKNMPLLVIIIDELADLLQTHGKEVEPAIIQLTQKARAAGIHLILATQRPSADIIPPIIRSNCPTRISFKVGSSIDSRTILDQPGAEKLLGRGDMFLREPSGTLLRIHGAFVTDEEIERVTDFLKAQSEPEYVDGVTDEPQEEDFSSPSVSGEKEQLYDQAVNIVIQENRASCSYLQRRLGIGYNRAANIIEQMEKDGIVSKANATGKRSVLVPKGENF